MGIWTGKRRVDKEGLDQIYLDIPRLRVTIKQVNMTIFINE
jgi:hypothetical protein